MTLFFHQLRQRHPWFVRFLFGVCVIFFLMITSFISRQTPDWSAQDFELPFRSLTPKEAAILLACDQATMQHSTPSELVLHTDVFPFPDTGAVHRPTCTYDSQYYVFAYISDIGSDAEYHINRADLARVYAGDLPHVYPSGIRFRQRISFNDQAIPTYVAFEFGTLISVWIMMLLCIRFYPAALWLPVLTVIMLGIMVITAWYSPTLFAADYYHQRLILEDIAIVGWRTGPLLLWGSGGSLLYGLISVCYQWWQRVRYSHPAS